MKSLISRHVARKAFDRLSHRLLALPAWALDQGRSTYSSDVEVPPGPLRHLLKAPPAQPERDRERILQLAEKYLDHQFDIYGSGWKPAPRLAPLELPRTVRARSDELAHKMARTYTPIDWHRDLKTGHYWKPGTWFQNIKKSGLDADVRRPWELARAHHWTVLARAYLFTREPRFAQEIENQFYDFTSANPPRYGVNWSSTMDVAIRGANWCLAWDLLQSAGAPLSAGFLADFKQSLWEHGRHVLFYQESSPSDRANHYLAGLCGLAFLAVYLPNEGRTRTWAKFARRELKTELRRQFLADGGSFEGSTFYHRLSCEMALYALGALKAAGYALPEESLAILHRALRFSDGVIKPTGEAPQIGDNDGGRFLKIEPTVNERLEENPLDQRHLQIALRALTGGTGESFEAQVLRALFADRKLPPLAAPGPALSVGDPKELKVFHQQFQSAPVEHRQSYRIAWPRPLLMSSLRGQHWPDFGLYVIRDEGFYLAIRCDERRHCSMEGHAHNDLFAVELQVDGIDYLRDPGSYIYYPDPGQRNAYRSIASHFPSQLLAAHAGEAFNRMLFTFTNRLAGKCEFFSPAGFVGRTQVAGLDFHFAVQIQPDHVDLRMYSPVPLPAGAREPSPALFSPGYGRRSDEASYARVFIVDST